MGIRYETSGTAVTVAGNLTASMPTVCFIFGKPIDNDKDQSKEGRASTGMCPAKQVVGTVQQLLDKTVISKFS